MTPPSTGHGLGKPDRPTLLVVGAGAEAAEGIRVARRLGLHVVATDRDPCAPGLALADDGLVASTYDVEATCEAALHFHRHVRPLDGVICIASDVPRTVAAVAEALGLPGLSSASAHWVSDKLAMKQRLAEAGVPVPWFASVASADELESLARREGPSLVVKPVDSRGARGVVRWTPPLDLRWAFDFAQRESPSGRVLVERFLPGPQVSTESLVCGGRVHTVGLADRNYELLERFAPHMIENGGALPSRLDAATQQRIHALVADAAAALGISEGVVKGDVVVHQGGPHLIELAGRLSGGRFCTHEIPLATGVDFVAHAIRLALGIAPDPAALRPRFSRGVAQRYLFPAPGRVVRVAGEQAVRRAPGIAFCEVRVAPGDEVGPIYCHPARAGSVIATGDTREQAMARAVAAVSSIRIETDSADAA